MQRRRANGTKRQGALRPPPFGDLYKRGTQTVFGDGLARARIVILGEQPGHDRALAAAAILRAPDDEARHLELDRRGADLAHVRAALA